MNEGLRIGLRITVPAGPITVHTSRGAVELGQNDILTQKPDRVVVERAVPRKTETWRRELRPKGSKL